MQVFFLLFPTFLWHLLFHVLHLAKCLWRSCSFYNCFYHVLFLFLRFDLGVSAYFTNKLLASSPLIVNGTWLRSFISSELSYKNFFLTSILEPILMFLWFNSSISS